MEYLYGVRAENLDDANAHVEQALNVRMEAREGLHNGGDYFSRKFIRYSLKLRENIDLDDSEMEFNGLHEPSFPNYKWLLYVEGNEIPADTLALLDGKPKVFVKLKSR